MNSATNKALTNLEQVRAARALKDAENIIARRSASDGDQLSGYYSLIITNGLLATFAYSAAKGSEYRLIAESLLGHLRALQQAALFPGEPVPTELMDALNHISAKADNDLLRMMTAESMAYLNYLKRFGRALNKKASS